MENQSQSERQKDLMIGYVIKSLSDAEKEEFEGYLNQDDALLSEMKALEEVMGLIAHTAPPVAAPQRLRDRILDDIQPNSSQPALLKSKPQRWRWEWIAAGIAAIFIGGLGLQNHFLLQELVAHQEEEEQTTFAFTLAKDGVSVPTGEIVLDLELGRALFAIQNLPPLKSGETYTLWAFTEDESIFCGSFAPNAAGQVVTQIAVPIDEYGSPIVSMQVFKGKASFPADLKQSVPIMTSQI